MHIEYDFQTMGEPLSDPYLDATALEQLFAQTRADLGNAIQRQLGDLRCPEHGQAPSVLVRGIYDHTTEQMDVSYGVDTCCPPFLLRVVQVLHRIG